MSNQQPDILNRLIDGVVKTLAFVSGIMGVLAIVAMAGSMSNQLNANTADIEAMKGNMSSIQENTQYIRNRLDLYEELGVLTVKKGDKNK